MKLSIIIPTLNEEARITPCLLSLLADTSLAEPPEIIVSDGGSSDRTTELAAQFPSVIVLKSAPGRARQMNQAALQARGDVLCFLHADSVLPSAFLGLIEQAFSCESSTGASTHCVFFRFAVDSKRWRYRLMEFLVYVRAEFLKIPYGDQALCLRRKLFFDLGGYREDLRALEDLYLVRALRKKGKAGMRCTGAKLLTSARRYEERGFLRTVCRHALMILHDWCVAKLNYPPASPMSS